MTTIQLSSHEIAERGEALYRDRIKALVKTPETLGNMVIIDVETGDYEVGDRDGIEATDKLLAKHKNALLYALRIGYETSVTFGGIMRREEDETQGDNSE